MRTALSALLFTSFISSGAYAQEIVWVQVEAEPTLSGAQDRVRVYAGRLENVNGYYLGSGWYGIALGPYTPQDAETVLRDLRNAGVIPQDSFIADGSRFQQQFWPVGVGAPTTAQPIPGSDAARDTATADQDAEVADVIAPEVEPNPIPAPDETLGEARASEAQLDREAKQQLQIALKWAGFYDAAIDGAFGRGTRAAMSAWQDSRNVEVTGVLTTQQRADLLNDYNAVLDGMNLQTLRDDATGIEISIPTGVVEFAEYEPPFARFDPIGDIDARVLLISQEGDQTRLFGLYEILQTLAIIPAEGARNRADRAFEINGMDDKIASYTFARLENGQIKGFSLIWPAGDEDRRTRILDEMKASFTTVDGVLDPAIATPDEEQAIDLIAGLQVRKPRLARSGFFIDARGDVLTTTEAVDDCASITINAEYDAAVVHRDDALGIAVLRPDTPLAPVQVAALQTRVPRITSEVAVAGFPYGGVLSAPSLTFGTLADIRGLNGEDTIKRLAIHTQPGDAGGPVFDAGGAVLGMLLPRVPVNGQILPPEVGFAVDADQIIASLQTAEISPQTTDTVAYMTPEIMTLMAADVTVLVSCWDD
ncbi:peptidoglycan-binding protein [Octadecabacter sp. SW4]|uniref:serine protease n=1 Tax=Octadecabacter sp. SW4 TaxID=2602067 RepID=UPI0011C20893|nr:serine protease [Octadecabacter sp. SW4]QEE36157.1 peptidoglycan-binding protein [Octadecabacter sp. SW4]